MCQVHICQLILLLKQQSCLCFLLFPLVYNSATLHLAHILFFTMRIFQHIYTTKKAGAIAPASINIFLSLHLHLLQQIHHLYCSHRSIISLVPCLCSCSLYSLLDTIRCQHPKYHRHLSA